MADWEEVTDPNEAKKVLGADTFARMQKGAGGKGSLDPQTRKFLNEQSTLANDAAEARRIYEAAQKPIERFKPSPGRGRFFEMMTPEEGGSFLDTIGGVVSVIPKTLGAITPQESQDFQTLRGYQSQQVLRRQLEQKGVQTESDAARLATTELSPMKDKNVNMRIINEGKARAERAQARAIFYGIWTNKYGLNGTDPEGNTADELWAKSADYITKRLIHGAPAKSRQGQGGIKVLSRTKVR